MLQHMFVAGQEYDEACFSMSASVNRYLEVTGAERRREIGRQLGGHSDDCAGVCPEG